MTNATVCNNQLPSAFASCRYPNYIDRQHISRPEPIGIQNGRHHAAKQAISLLETGRFAMQNGRGNPTLHTFVKI